MAEGLSLPLLLYVLILINLQSNKRCLSEASGVEATRRARLGMVLLM